MRFLHRPRRFSANLICVMGRTHPIWSNQHMRPADELEQLEDSISDLEHRIFEASGRLAQEAGTHGFVAGVHGN